MSALRATTRALAMRQVATATEASAATGLRIRQLSGSAVGRQTIYVIDLGAQPAVLSVYGLGPRRIVWLTQSGSALCSAATLARAQQAQRDDGQAVAWIAGRSARDVVPWSSRGGTAWWSDPDAYFELQSSDLSVSELIALSASVG